MGRHSIDVEQHALLDAHFTTNFGNKKKKKKRSMGHPLKQAYICIGIDMLQHQQSSTHSIDVEQHALLDAHFTTKFWEPKKKKRSMRHPLKQAYIRIGIDMLQH